MARWKQYDDNMQRQEPYGASDGPLRCFQDRASQARRRAVVLGDIQLKNRQCISEMRQDARSKKLKKCVEEIVAMWPAGHRVFLVVSDHDYIGSCGNCPEVMEDACQTLGVTAWKAEHSLMVREVNRD